MESLGRLARWGAVHIHTSACAYITDRLPHTLQGLGELGRGLQAAAVGHGRRTQHLPR